MINSKFTLFTVSFILLIFTLYYSNIPFFWDGTLFSELACKFYDKTYTPISFPPYLDNTSFPIYSTYLFAIWTLFSKTLLISHLAFLPFLIGICYEYYKLSKRFLTDTFVSFALILLILEPTFITQSLLMSLDIIPLYLFLVLVNLLLKENFKLYSFIIPVLALYSIRGLVLAFSIIIIQFILLYPKYKKTSFIIFLKSNLLCFFLIIVWYVFHKFKTGWFIFSIEKNDGEKTIPLSMTFRQLLFITWKLADFGRVVLWLIIIFGSFIIYKRNALSASLKKILLFTLLPALILILVMIFITNPAGHRYFMFTYLLLNISVCYILSNIKNKFLRNTTFIVCCISLFTGNFWLYPERFGNGWDSSLKVLPYFSLKDDMDNYILQNKIAPEEIGTQFPLINDKRFSHLTDSSFHFTNVWRGPISNYKYYLQTNVINTDIPEQIEEVKSKWILVKGYKKGLVYLNLYKNPKN